MVRHFTSWNQVVFSSLVYTTAQLSLVHCFILQGYHGAAVGKGRQLAKTELEKLKLSELSTREAVFEAARM